MWLFCVAGKNEHKMTGRRGSLGLGGTGGKADSLFVEISFIMFQAAQNGGPQSSVGVSCVCPAARVSGEQQAPDKEGAI